MLGGVLLVKTAKALLCRRGSCTNFDLLHGNAIKEMRIFNIHKQLILNVEVDDSSYRYRAIKGEHSLTLKYSLAEHVELPVGCYCLYQGEKYSLERPESFKMKHTRYFEYTVTMEAYQSKSKIWKFRNLVDGRLKFPLTAKPIEHLQMFVDNMNTRDKGWKVGECIDGTEHLINYDHNYCWDALSKMASEFKTEFEITGKKVSLRKVEYNKNNPLSLSYGRGNGFKSGLGRSNSSNTPPIEILFVQGGTANIDRSVYGNSELHLPKKQIIDYDGEHFKGEVGFSVSNSRRYIVDDLGMSIRRFNKQLSSLAEDSLDCSDIYPKRVGTISEVIVVNSDKNFYDIVDNTIPDALNYENCLIKGETMTVIFQSGMLAGREFEVKYFHKESNKGGVYKPAHRFEIVPQEIDGITMPNATFSPKKGDKYAVFKVMLPQAYICDNATKTGAEWDMFKTAVKYLFDNEEQKFTFTGELDGIWAKRDWTNIGGRIILGGYILFRDDRFQKEGVLVRITGIKDYINNPHSPTIEISNDTISGGFTSELKKLQSDEVLVEENHKQAIQFTKRRFRDVKETMLMLEESLLDNYTNTISPIAIQTMQLLVGDESLQFRFVENTNSTTSINHPFDYDAKRKFFHTDGGIVQHLTLGINSLSSQRSATAYKSWAISGYTSAVLDDAKKKYYLYIKASKKSWYGDFLLSERAIKMEEVSGYYHFLVGVLNSEYEGNRSFVPLYGFTEILPGRITTDRIVSSDGDSYFDMAANAMKLGDKLKYINNILYLDCLFSKGANIGNWIFDGVSLKSQNGACELDGINGMVVLNGFIRRQMLYITKDNIGKYTTQNENGDLYIDYFKAGRLITLNYINDGQICIFPSLYGGENPNIRDSIRSYIGESIVIYNNTRKQIGITGALAVTEYDTNFVSPLIENGEFIFATCKIRVGQNGREQVYWLFKKGYF